MSIELDQLDKLAASVFDGYLVRKDLVRKYSRQYPVPTYVVEFLLGRYCASVDESEIAEGLEIVEKQLKDRTVRTGEEELFKARAKETGSVKIIDILRARLDAKNDCYIAELPSLNLRDVRIDDQLVRDNERMLTDGFYAEVTLAYDGIIAQEKGGRPFKVDRLCARSKCPNPTCWTSMPRPAEASARPNGSTFCCVRLVLSQPPSTSARSASFCCA